MNLAPLVSLSTDTTFHTGANAGRPVSVFGFWSFFGAWSLELNS
jgi:hypothetical protein